MGASAGGCWPGGARPGCRAEGQRGVTDNTWLRAGALGPPCPCSGGGAGVELPGVVTGFKVRGVSALTSPTVGWPGHPHAGRTWSAAGLPVLRRSSRGRCWTLQGQEGRVLHACEPRPGCLFSDGLQRKNGFYAF